MRQKAGLLTIAIGLSLAATVSPVTHVHAAGYKAPAYQCSVGGPTAKDLHFCLNKPSLWVARNLKRTSFKPAANTFWKVTGPHPVLQSRVALNLPLAGFTGIRVDMAVAKGFAGQSMMIYFRLNNEKVIRSFGEKLFPTNAMREYGFNFNVLKHVPAHPRMTLLWVGPVMHRPNSGPNVVQILDVRLVRGSGA